MLKQTLKTARNLYNNTNLCRNVSKSAQFSNPKTYEGEGKTSVNILNSEEGAGLMIDGFSQVGFRLNNNVTILGSMVIFPRSVLSWTLTDINDISDESLSLFTILEPKPDILVIGIGDKPKNFEYFKRIIPLARRNKLCVEILATEQACATFNFLNSEGRYVIGAMIPPQEFTPTDHDLLQSKMRYQNLYERD